HFHSPYLTFLFTDTPTAEISTLSLHDALPIFGHHPREVATEDVIVHVRRDLKAGLHHRLMLPPEAFEKPGDHVEVGSVRGHHAGHDLHLLEEAVHARMESLQMSVPRGPRLIQTDLFLPLPSEIDPRGEPHEEGRDGQVGNPNRGDASEQQLSESVHEETPGKQGEQEDD